MLAMRRLRPSGAVLVLLAAVFGMTSAAAAAERLVRLDAVLAKGGEPVYDAMAIGVWRMQDGEPVERIAERHAAPAEVALDPGEYRIQAVYGKARRVTDITVAPDGAGRRTINLEAGRVRLKLLDRPGGEAVADPVAWEVRRYRRGADPGRKVAALTAEQPGLWLAAGWYEVAARYRGRTVEHVVEVSAGQTLTYSIVLGTDEG